jgi:hypothetical protein
VNRREAIELIREINEECENIRGTSIMLKTPKETDILSKGYQVHLIMEATTPRIRCLEVVARQYGYAIKIEPERFLVIVYKSPHGHITSTLEGRA